MSTAEAKISRFMYFGVFRSMFNHSELLDWYLLLFELPNSFLASLSEYSRAHRVQITAHPGHTESTLHRLIQEISNWYNTTSETRSN
jgi:hypothetical protein